MSSYERLATVVALVTLGLGLSLIINPPLVWGFVALLVITTCVGTGQVLRGSPIAGRGDIGLAVFVLPSLIVLGGFLFLRLPAFAHGVTVALGLIVTAALLGMALYAEDQTNDPASPRYRRARLILNLIAWVIAFALFSAIFAPKVRSIVSATAILVASALIAAELFRGAGRGSVQPVYVAVVALTLGQVTWALNYWVLGALTGGAILLLVFYTLTGIIRSHLDGTLAPVVLTEHLAVVGAGLVAVIAGGLWLR
ncbi:MAG TPA: hypothetical protein VNL16_02880 [Chloroflexota bacterium]|nr:hypothetical protein [Chloroflexota bacterium]